MSAHPDAYSSVTEFILNNQTPREIFSPRTLDELANIVAECNRTHTAIIPWGGGTQQHLGNLARVTANKFVVVNTAHLNRVVEYSPDDLIVTVESGTTLRALEKILRARIISPA